MKDLKITKGEWILEKSSNFSNRTNVYANGKKHTVIEDYTRTEQEANAKLIAAAPDLFKACKMAEKLIGTMNATSKSMIVYDAIINAIEKATE